MSATENVNRKNRLPQDFPEKFSGEEKNFDESVTFTPLELKYYNAEIKEMLESGKIINVPKAIHNAKYFAELEEREKEIEEGRVVSFTDEEWEKFINA